VDGIRAAVVHDTTTALLARHHNDANVVSLGERTTGRAEAIDAVDAFVTTDFDGGRHQRRIDQITDIERQQPTP
jgi:ribose 5-phosphate isomerase B